MSERAAYSRVYWSVMEDPKFDGIRENVRHFGAWSMMLIIADMAWPAPAYVPPTIPKSCLEALVDATLVDPLTGGRFRIHGLEAERARRRDAATRPGPSRPPTAPQPGPNRDPVAEQDEDETRTRQDETRESHTRDSANALHERTGRFPSTKVLAWLDDLGRQAGAQDHHAGEVRITALIDATPLEGRNVKDYLNSITDAFRQQDRDADRAERSAEATRNEAKRQPVKLRSMPSSVTPEEAAAEVAAYEAEYGRKPA